MAGKRLSVSAPAQWIRNHPRMFVLLFVQVAVLFVFAAGCFGSVFSARLTSDDLFEGEGLIEYSPDGEGIGVYGEYNAGAYYEILYTENYSLRPGAYDITVEYAVTRDDTLPEDSQPVALGMVELRGGQRDHMLWDGDIYLVDWRETQTQRLWVSFPYRTESTELAVVYQATGDLFIKSVTIEELPIWRFSRLLIALVLFALLDGFLWFFFISEKHGKTDRLSVMAGILCVGFSSLLAVNSKIIYNGDLLFHLGRIINMSNSLFAGQIPIRMQTGAVNGYGALLSLFYSDLFLTLPAALYHMAFPVQVCYQVYIIAINTFTYWIAYISFKHISRQNNIATVGASLYTLAVYRLSCLYERSAVGDYTAMIFLPLVVYGLWKLYTARDDARFSILLYGPLILGLSGLIQSNIRMTLMASVPILVFCILLLPKTLKPKRLLALMKTIGLVLLVNLWFLWPILDSMSTSLSLEQSTQYNALGRWAAETSYLLGGLSQGHDWQDSLLSNAFSLGLSLVCGLAFYLICICKRDQWKITHEPDFKAASHAFLFAVLSLWMCSIFFPWRAVDAIGGIIGYYLKYAEFPWRYLAYASVFSVLTIVLLLTALFNKGQRTIVRTISITLLSIAVLISGTMIASMPARLGLMSYYSSLPQDAIVAHHIYFLPPGSNLDKILTNPNRPTSTDVQINNYKIQGDDYIISVANPSEETVVKLPRYYYNNYHAYDQDSGEEFALQTAEDKMIEVVVPEGYEGTIVLRYVPPVSWRIAEIVSLLATAAYLLLYFQSRRQKGTL